MYILIGLKPLKENEVMINKDFKKDVGSTMLSVVLSDATFAEKVEAVRKVNPYFYLLTPKPRKGK